MPGPDLLRVPEHHHQRRQWRDEDVHGGGEVADDALVEAEPHPPGRADPLELGRAEQVQIAHRPAVLLVDVRGEVVGRGALGDQHRDVQRPVALGVQAEPGEEVLAVVEPGEPAGPVDRDPPVDGVAAAADGGVTGVAGGLDPAEEPLLRGTGGALDPAHRLVGVEALRALDDADPRVGEVRDEVAQEVGPGREVRVEDGDELTGAERERVVEVAGLLEVPPVGPHHVPVPVRGRQVGDLGPVGVVEHPDGQRTGPVDLGHRPVGVLQDVQRLAAGRQVEVDGRQFLRRPRVHQHLVGLPGEPPLPQAVDRGQRQRDDIESQHGEEHPQRWRPQREREHRPGGENERRRTRDQHPPPLRPEVPVELLVVRRLRQMRRRRGGRG